MAIVALACNNGCGAGEINNDNPNRAGDNQGAGSSGGSASGGSANATGGGGGGVGGRSSGGAAGTGVPIYPDEAGTSSGGGAAQFDASIGREASTPRADGGSSRDTGSPSNTSSDRGVFSQCRFHFGTTDGVARNNPSMIAQLDFFTPGWMGQGDNFDMKGVCDSTKPGAVFANQVPVIVAYVAAFYAKRHFNLKDCNAPGSQQSLCQAGAQAVQQNLSAILGVYESYAQGFAGCYGTTRPIIFQMEPDFYQYTDKAQSQPWTAAQAGQIMSQFVAAMKKHLPNAVFSLDISPWVDGNGGDNGRAWYGNFDMSQFTFINTSGGGTDAGNSKIRSANQMTWAGVSSVTGKPIMADTGYGVNGSSAGPDSAWDDANNINARIDDGVASISQYNPSSNWGSTIGAVRSQLKAPRSCQ